MQETPLSKLMTIKSDNFRFWDLKDLVDRVVRFAVTASATLALFSSPSWLSCLLPTDMVTELDMRYPLSCVRQGKQKV